MEERTKLKKDETRKCGSGGTDGRARGERNEEGHAVSRPAGRNTKPGSFGCGEARK